MATLWYNGDSDDKGAYINRVYTTGRSSVPAASVFDDFTIRDSQTWNITEIWSNNFNAPPSTTALWSIRSGMSPGNGGTVLFSGTSPVTQTLTGRFRSRIQSNGWVFVDPEYQFKVSGLNINLASGTYWLQVSPYSSGDVSVGTTSGANSVGTRPENSNNALWKWDGVDPNLRNYDRIEQNFSMGVGNDDGKQPPASPPIPAFTTEGIIFVLSPNSDRVNLIEYPQANNKFVLAFDGDDFVQGTRSFDSINGNQGNDEIRGGAGDDFILGGKDNDLLYGDEGNDILNGNKNDDVVRGGWGNDTANGGQGNDIVLGDEGDDILSGDFGIDTLWGGSGNDQFFLRADRNQALGLSNTASKWQLADIITDFSTPNMRSPRLNPNESDKIVLNNGLSFVQLAFEAISINVDGVQTRPATAIKIGSNGDYLGVLLNINPNDLRAEDFITVNSLP